MLAFIMVSQSKIWNYDAAYKKNEIWNQDMVSVIQIF